MFELPQFTEINHNGIKLDKVLIERVCCSLEDDIKIDRPMNIEISEWLYIVRVCSGDGRKYLYLDINDKSVEVEHLRCNGKYPQNRIITLTDCEAYRIINELSEFGKEYCENNISEFQDIMNTMLEIIPCEVFIYPFSSNGFYDKSHNSIHIANNKTQYTILSSIIHEYTHYILAHSPRDRVLTWKEYYLDEDENICNAVAHTILSFFIPEYIMRLDSEFQHALDEYKQYQHNCENMRIDTQIYMQQCLASGFATEHGNDETVISIVDSILDKYRDISNKGLFKKQNIAQSELFILLSLEENKKFAILACGAAVGIYFGCRNFMGTETLSWLCMLGAAPFAALGFIRYNGMYAEQIAKAWIRSEILMPRHLTFTGKNEHYDKKKKEDK